MKEVGTLKELGVKVGDVVECVEWCGEFYTAGKKYDVIDGWGERYLSIGTKDNNGLWRIVFRASDTPKLWCDMTPEEKGALLLAAYEGKTIQYQLGELSWADTIPTWYCNFAYRVKPEPVVETVTRFWGAFGFKTFASKMNTHLITFNIIDGKPDCSSIKMEEL